MWLHKFHVNLRSREARRDVADPYQMHATLCRVFSPPSEKCPPGEFHWRIEPETDSLGNPRVLIQSRSMPDWSRLELRDWLAGEVHGPIDILSRLSIETNGVGSVYRYRLRANPSVCKGGKRLGLLKTEDQNKWLERKSLAHGFSLKSIHISEEKMLSGNRNDGAGGIRVFSVLFDGALSVTDPVALKNTLSSGIGRGKALGLGLLSLAPFSAGTA